MSGQTETHSLGFLSVADSASTSGRKKYRTKCCGRMVMHPAADFFIADSNPGRANMAAPPPMAVDWQGFEPPTKKSAASCVTIRPWFGATVQRIPTVWSLLTTNIMSWDDIWDDNLGFFYANDPKKGGVYDARACT